MEWGPTHWWIMLGKKGKTSFKKPSEFIICTIPKGCCLWHVPSMFYSHQIAIYLWISSIFSSHQKTIYKNIILCGSSQCHKPPMTGNGLDIWKTTYWHGDGGWDNRLFYPHGLSLLGIPGKSTYFHLLSSMMFVRGKPQESTNFCSVIQQQKWKTHHLFSADVHFTMFILFGRAVRWIIYFQYFSIGFLLHSILQNMSG